MALEISGAAPPVVDASADVTPAAPTRAPSSPTASPTNSVERFGGQAQAQLSKQDLMTIGRVVDDFFKLISQIGQKPDASTANKLDLGVILTEVVQLVEQVFAIAKKFDTGAASSAGKADQGKAEATKRTPGTDDATQQTDQALAQAGDAALDVAQQVLFQDVKEENHSSNVKVGGTNVLGHAHAHHNVAGMAFDAEAIAQTTAEAGASSTSHVGKDGVSGQAKAGARVGMAAGAKATMDTPMGRGYAGVKAGVTAYAETEAHYQANLHGANAGASAAVGAMGTADAYAGFNSKDGQVGMDARASAEAGTGADASANATLSLTPPTALVEGKAGAFAGARAGACAQANIGGLTAKTTVGVSAGAGAEIDFKAALGADGKFHFTLGIAASVGVGVKYSTDISFDPKDFGSLLLIGLMAIGGPLSSLLTMVPALLQGGVSGMTEGAHANTAIDQAVGEGDEQKAPPKPPGTHTKDEHGTYMGDIGFVTSRDEPSLVDSADDTRRRANSMQGGIMSQAKTQTIAKG